MLELLADRASLLSVQVKNIVTTRKRSLGRGNVFTGVCQSFCPQKGVFLSVRGYVVDTPSIYTPCTHKYTLDMPPPPDTYPTHWTHIPWTPLGQQAGSTYLTGMLSCFSYVDVSVLSVHNN